jgi:predicted Zn-dependent peptidase
VVIAGDVKLADVKRLADQYLAPIPAQAPPREVKTVEPLQKGERRVYVQKASVSTPNVMLGYHVPSTSNADYYALDLLSSILTTGNSSRMYQGLVDKQVAIEVETYMPMSFDANLFYVMGVANPGVTATELEKGMIAEINRVAREGVTENELEKVKNIKLMGFYQAMETINGKANTIGTYELFFGSYDKLFNAPQAYNKVTPADIQRVAQTYLKRSNRTVAVLAAIEETDE